MSEFKIDFFELMFLAEVCIPQVPIARAMFFENMSDTYYHQMSPDERIKAFEWIIYVCFMDNFIFGGKIMYI